MKMSSFRDQDQIDIVKLLREPGVSERAIEVTKKFRPNDLPDLMQMIAMAEIGY